MASVEEAREAFLNMIVEAIRWDEVIDEGQINYHLTVRNMQLEEFCETIGIRAELGYSLKSAIDDAASFTPEPRPCPHCGKPHDTKSCVFGGCPLGADL